MCQISCPKSVEEIVDTSLHSITKEMFIIIIQILRIKCPARYLAILQTTG